VPRQTLAAVAGKINTRGVNGADPVTKPGDCVGTKVTQALIACLQPDRRVDVEVTGKRQPWARLANAPDGWRNFYA